MATKEQTVRAKPPAGGAIILRRKRRASVSREVSPEKAAALGGTMEHVYASQLISEVADGSADVAALCADYGLKREELGRLTGFSLRALAEWAAHKRPSLSAKRRLHEIRRLLDALAEIVDAKKIPGWLHHKQPVFDGMTPLQVIEVGEIDRLWAMVHDMGSSDPG